MAVTVYELEARERKALAIFREIPTFVSAEELKLLSSKDWARIAGWAGQKPPSEKTQAMIIKWVAARDDRPAMENPFAGLPTGTTPGR